MTTTWIEPGERPAALEVWRTYDRHASSISDDLLHFRRKHPELGVGAPETRQGIEQHHRATAERLRAVFAGDWNRQEQHLRQEGARQAQEGLSFQACCDLAGAFQRRLLPLLMEDLGPTSPRLPAAIDVLLRFGERSLACLGDAYLEAKQTLLSASERKNASIREESRQIQEANRLKSEFLANMSHELRTPLNAIIGFTELLQDGAVEPNSSQSQEFLNHILLSGRHLLQVINDILDLAKVEAGRLEFHPERADLGSLAEEVLSVLRAGAANKRVRIHAEVGPGLDALLINPARLKQVLYNYLSNALKFTPEGGSVVLRASTADQERFRIEVEDTGIGIEPADIGRLFVEFQQLDDPLTKRHGGTGLGLALTRRLVEAQGGQVGVLQSRPGEGSCFFAELPRAAVTRRPLPVQPAPLAPPGAPVVLVVEDNPRDTEVIVSALADAGYGVELAASGGQAIEAASKRRFAAITLDLVLPDMSGIEALRHVRKAGLNAATPVVVVTVSADGQIMAGFAVQDVLPKPLDSSALIAALQRTGVTPDDPGTVMVLDDDARALDLMAASLKQLGYRNYCTSSGQEALDWCREHLPLAVIVDLLMPGMNGFEFLERFRELPRSRHVPVIVWTIKDLSAGERATLRLSSQAVVPKNGSAALMEELSSFSRAGRQGAGRVTPIR